MEKRSSSPTSSILPTTTATKIFGSFLVNLTGSVTWRGARTVSSLREQQGVQLVASAAGGYLFTSGGLLALTAAYTAELLDREAPERVVARGDSVLALQQRVDLLQPKRALQREPLLDLHTVRGDLLPLVAGVGSGNSGHPRSGKSGHLKKGARDGKTTR